MSLTGNAPTGKIAASVTWARQFIKTRRARNLGIIAIVFFIIFSITGFFILPPYVKGIAIEKLSKQLGRSVSIQSVSLNPYALSATIRGLVIKEPDRSRTFFSFDSLYINVQIMSLFRGGLVVKEIKVEKPYFHIVHTAANAYNFSDILERSNKPADSSASKSKPLGFSLNNISVSGGSVDFIDMPMGKEHTVRDLSLGIPFISDFPSYVDIYVKPSLKATVNGSDFTFGGDAKPFSSSLETSLNINLKDLNIPFYMTYLPVKPRAKIRSGRLDIGLGISFRRPKNHPLALTVSGNILLKKLDVADLRNKPVVSFDALTISIASAEPFEKRFSFSNVILQSPTLALNRDRRGALSLLSLMPERKTAVPETSPSHASAASIEANNIELRKGVITFSDASNAKPFAMEIRQIEARAAHFSTLKDKPTAFSASFITESGETVKVDGDLGMDPLFYEGKLSVTSLLLKKYMPYLVKQVNFDIADGKLDLITKISYHLQIEKPVMRLYALETSLKDFRLVRRTEKEAFLKVPVFSIKDTSVDLTEQKVDIGSMSTDKGLIIVRKNKDGSLNISNLTPPAPAYTHTPAPAPARKSKPWIAMVRSLNAGSYAARIEDLSLASPFKLDIDHIAVKGKGISTAKNAKGTVSVSCRVAKKGTITVSGTIFPEAVKTALSINIKNLPISPLQPYVDEKARVLITGGAINAGGKVTAAMTPKEGLKAAYKGKVRLNNFATADAANAEDLLKWDTLYLGEMDIRYAPLFVLIDDISLTNFYSRVVINIVNKNRTINLREILITPQPPQQSAGQEQTVQATAQPRQQSTAKKQTARMATQLLAAARQPSQQKMIKISKITLQGGKVDFTDNSISPNFHTNISDLGGSITGLSSEENKFGAIELKGKYDGYAPLDITGRINPLRNDLYAELKFDFKDMDLTPVSPYSGHYAGYTIREGKLFFQLEYLIVKNRLDAKNNLFIDQFNFGDRVESPEATKLPVRLAIALLKDRNGEIKLDIPVSGDLDDPKFSISSVIWRIIKNLLVKVATSPFSLLGAIFGGGEQLSYVEFDYGVPTLSVAAQKKLDTVVKMLYERPSLKMDIEGYVDPEKDREGLKQYLLMRKVKAQKIKELARQGTEVPSLDAVTVTDKEYPEYLKRAYKEEKFPKPRNFIGMAKSLPAPEMEKLMLTNTKVTDEDLKSLASERAGGTKDYILKSKQVEPERIFFVQPKSLAPEKKESVKNSRVEFKLK